METRSFSIGQLASHTDCKVETVHYYEKVGLMPEPARSTGGHRIYNQLHLQRLAYIRRSRKLGFSIGKIRELLTFIDEPDHNCGEVKTMALQQCREIQQKIDDLQHLKQALNEMLKQCQTENNATDDCPIINTLYSASVVA